MIFENMENTIIKYGIFLAVVGFIFILVIRENKKSKKEQNQKLKKNIQEMEMEKMRNELDVIKNRRIAVSLVRLFMGTLTMLGGITIVVVNREYGFGSILFVTTALLNIIFLRWTIQDFRRLKELKNILKNDEIFIEERKIEIKKIYILALALIVLAIGGIIGIKIIENILMKTL
jgi:hypothetical protein